MEGIQWDGVDMKERKGRRKHTGSITVEACLVIPLFLFFMLAMADIIMLLLAEAHIHQSLAEAAGYTAQYAYLEDGINTGRKKRAVSEGKPVSNQDTSKAKGGTEKIVNFAILVTRFQKYLGDDYYVERMISGGKGGIILSIKEDVENPKIFVAKAGYCGRFKVPLLGEITVPLTNQIKQKAFVGYSEEEQEVDTYVYITPEQSVYHTTRNCTHLSLSVRSAAGSQKNNYTPCSFCGRRKNTTGKIYISRTGNVYHNNPNCSGLKRTVKRVKKKEAGGLGPCSRCGSR